MSDLVQKLVGALQDCLDDSHQVLAQMEQMYGMNYRQDRLEAQRKTIADAEAALSAAKDGGWQPIETAPKDTMVLVASEFFGPADWRIKVGYFFTDENKWVVFGASWTPTKWQPLPNPPKEQA